jgi:sialic acid synthase SpsE
MAVALGAEVIEKHFTFNRDDWGSDHKVSLLPKEMKELVDEINFGMPVIWDLTDKALGVKTKYIQEGEERFRNVFRKGLYASHHIPAGKILEPEDFYALRPKSDALRSELYPSLIGTLAVKEYQRYESFK